MARLGLGFGLNPRGWTEKRKQSDSLRGSSSKGDGSRQPEVRIAAVAASSIKRLVMPTGSTSSPIGLSRKHRLVIQVVAVLAFQGASICTIVIHEVYPEFKLVCVSGLPDGEGGYQGPQLISIDELFGEKTISLGSKGLILPPIEVTAILKKISRTEM
jgi:hypothetical protein